MPKELQDTICKESTYNHIYNTHSEGLYRFLYYKYGNRDEAQDKVQEAFVKLWNKCKEVTPAKAKSFLFTVANNMMLNVVKHQKVVFA